MDSVRSSTPSSQDGVSIAVTSLCEGNSGDHDFASSNQYSSIDENDVVIAVMGLTGAGKSSFVNKAAGTSEAVIGNGLRSQTRGVQPVRCQHPDGRRNIVLVDTPGFDDTLLFDTQILGIIAKWLKDTYQNNVKLSGLLYLHRITDVRMAGTPLRNLAVFRDLCGADNLKNIVLVTTMWDEVQDEPVGSKREEELLSDFWKDMISLGSRTCRFQGTHESAWEIIDHLDLEGSNQKLAPLQIQREMVDRGLQFHETAAAKTLFRFLDEFLGECKKVWEKMRNGTRRTTSPRKPSGSPLRYAALRKAGTIRLNSSKSSRSAASLAENPPSSADSTSSDCAPRGRRDAVVAAIAVLRLAHQMTDIASIPILRGIIGTVLHIAQTIEEMGGAHHAIGQVIECSGWLLQEITQYAAKSKLSKDMKRTLSSFQKELNNLQEVVETISSRTHLTRFFLHDAEIRAITACTTSIRVIFDKLEVKLAMDNHRALANIEEKLALLCNSPALILRKCECGASLVHEESGET